MQRVSGQTPAATRIGDTAMAAMHARMPDLIGAFAGSSACGSYAGEALLRFHEGRGQHFVNLILREVDGAGKPLELPIFCAATPGAILGRAAKPDGSMRVDVEIKRTERPTMSVTIAFPEEQLAYKLTMPVRL